jgi:hypothetical protein
MGSTPTHVVKIDLNGTGTLVDVTTYVRLGDGLRASVGRSDWTAAEPRPGSFEFTLDNNDGRFTPGSTAVYTVGMVVGVIVEWTCGTRVRRFRAGPPELAFPLGVGRSSVVSVQCLDTLADLANRDMRQMVDEVAFAQQPVAYWPLADSGRGVDVQAQDISGNAESPLVPVGDAQLFSWGGGVGPSTDGRAALMLQPEATTAPANSATSPGLTLARPLGGSGVAHEWRIEPGRGSAFGEDYGGWGFSLWFAVRDIYGPTVGGGLNTDGPFVVLAYVDNVIALWRVADRRVIIGGWNGTVLYPMLDVPVCDVNEVHHLFIRRGRPASGGQTTVCYVDGVKSAAVFGSSSPSGAPPTRVDLGALPALVTPGTSPWGTTPFTLYALSGTLACAAIYTNLAAKTMDLGGDVAEFYPVGKTGPDELADARFQRIGNYLRRTDVAFVPQGTPQAALIGPQDTGGQSMLRAMCDALRLDEAVLDTETLAGVDTVRAWLTSENRPASAAVTINVDGDGDGVPLLSYDASGVAVQVQAKGFSTSVTWLDTAAPARWRDTSATLNAATDNVDDLRALAQFRSLLGRVETIVPTKVTINATTSAAGLTAALIALRPMQRIALTGLPSAVTGYSSVECILTGVTERHAPGRSMFELALTPDLPYDEGIVEDSQAGDLPEPFLFVPEGLPYAAPIERAQGIGTTGGLVVGRTYPQIDAVSSSDTSVTMTIAANVEYGVSYFLTALADWRLETGTLTDPIYLMIDSEIVLVTAATAAGVSLYSNADFHSCYVQTQTLTITRAQLGTTAAAHAQSGGDLNVAYAPHPIIHRFLGLDACATF